MNYQIVCVCGHRFFITEQQLTGHVTCPSCGRACFPVVTPQQPTGTGTVAAGAEGATPEAAVATSAEATKRCPFCGEVILAIAKKCKHCGEFLDRAVPEAGAAAAPSTAPAGSTAAASDAAASAGPQPGSNSANEAVFKLAVSQWDNFFKYLICGTIAFVAVAVTTAWRLPVPAEYVRIGVPAIVVLMGFIMWFFYFSTRNSRVTITPLRIETEVGILAKDLNTLELFRIIDIELKQNLIERMLGIGTVRVTSNDANTPELIIYQIPRARQVYKYLQAQVPIAARQRGAVYFEK